MADEKEFDIYENEASAQRRELAPDTPATGPIRLLSAR